MERKSANPPEPLSCGSVIPTLLWPTGWGCEVSLGTIQKAGACLRLLQVHAMRTPCTVRGWS